MKRRNVDSGPKRMRPGALICLCAVFFAFSGRGAEVPRFDIARHGASGDGKRLNTPAIQAAIDQCAQAGGGVVVVPKGEFLTGSLFLKPGVHLELQEGAVLRGSPDINDYPKIDTRIEGHFEPWRAALLNAEKCDHLRITGSGTLDGGGAVYWAEFWKQRKLNPKVTNLAVERPRLVFIRDSEDVRLSGILFKDSGFWNLHLYRSRKLAVDSCRFQAPDDPPPRHAASSDGIDVDSCQDVTISNCSFAVGDDCVALKGSKGPLAAHDASSPPVERVTIRDCTFVTGGAAVTFGSEATIVRDVVVERCKVSGKVPILRLKLRPDTAQLYENVACRGIVGEGTGAFFDVAPWKQFFDLKGQPAPSRSVRNVTISDVSGTFGSLGKIIGNAGDVIDGITLKNVDVTGINGKLETGGGVKNLSFENVKINGAPTSAATAIAAPAAMATPEAWNTF